MDGNLPEFR